MARIIYDLIMADKVIDEKEIEKFASLFGKDDCRELFLSAQEKTFADAVKSLKGPSGNPNDSDAVRRMNTSKRSRKAETAMNIVNEMAQSYGGYFTKYDIQ